ncbi:MAG: M1 family metallopeptidase [Planctomycetota bacterium]
MIDSCSASQRSLAGALAPFLFFLPLAGACAVPPSPRAAARAGDPFLAAPVRHSPGAAAFDVEHYAIEIRLLPAAREIEARTRVRLYPAGDSLAAVDLALAGLAVTAVHDEVGRRLAYSRAGETLSVQLAEPLAAGEYTELAIAYRGRPTTGLWFAGERPDGAGPTQVYSQGQAAHNHGWFPCLEDPADRATSEVIVTMPAGWRSVAAGERIDIRAEGERITEHWRMNQPHPAYLVTLVAGELAVREEEWNGVPLWYVAEPRYERWLEATFAETDDVLAFLADYTGSPYPYSKYSQAVVANFEWGGMENVSATTMSLLALDDERGHRDEDPHGLVAHEAAHQWFGDLLTCRDWSHLWLNEGFATYLELLYYERTRGEEEFAGRRRDALDRYLEAVRRTGRQPIVNEVYCEPEDLMDAHRYEGAAVRLHLLRSALGADVFRAGVRTYVAENAGRSVVTADLRRAMEKVSGRDLGWFFDQWIHGSGVPELEVSWRWDERARAVVLETRQLQSPGGGTPAAFRFPADVLVRDASGDRVHRVEVDERREAFELPAPGRPQFVRFDAGDCVPKVMTLVRAPAEWIAIAGADGDGNARRDAVLALGRLAREARIVELPAAHEAYVAEIVRRLRLDASPGVRADAASALGLAGGLEARERLIAAAREDRAARVRVAALGALCAWGENPALAAFAREAFDTGFSWATMGAAAGLVAAADPAGAYAWITEKLFTDSPHDQLAAYLLAQLGSLPNPGVANQLLAWARDESVDPPARAAALRQLPRQDWQRIANIRAVIPFLAEEDFQVRLAAVETLAAFDEPVARAALRDYYARAVTAKERRAIEAVLRGAP